MSYSNMEGIGVRIVFGHVVLKVTLFVDTTNPGLFLTDDYLSV